MHNSLVRPAKVAITVFLGTNALEIRQLWHPPFLEAIRAMFLGRTLIGTTFVPWGLLHDAVGRAVAALLVRALGGSAGLR